MVRVRGPPADRGKILLEFGSRERGSGNRARKFSIMRHKEFDLEPFVDMARAFRAGFSYVVGNYFYHNALVISVLIFGALLIGAPFLESGENLLAFEVLHVHF